MTVIAPQYYQHQPNHHLHKQGFYLDKHLLITEQLEHLEIYQVSPITQCQLLLEHK